MNYAYYVREREGRRGGAGGPNQLQGDHLMSLYHALFLTSAVVCRSDRYLHRFASEAWAEVVRQEGSEAAARAAYLTYINSL